MKNDLIADEFVESVKFSKETVNKREVLQVTFPEAKGENDKPLEFLVITDDNDFYGNSAFIAGAAEWDKDHIENDGESFQDQYGAPILSRDASGKLVTDNLGAGGIDIAEATKDAGSSYETLSEYLREAGVIPSWITATGINMKSVVVGHLNAHKESDPVVKSYLESISTYF